jgi:hypothetical protein
LKRKENIFFCLEKTLYPAKTVALYIVVNYKVVGLAVGQTKFEQTLAGPEILDASEPKLSSWDEIHNSRDL